MKKEITANDLKVGNVYKTTIFVGNTDKPIDNGYQPKELCIAKSKTTACFLLLDECSFISKKRIKNYLAQNFTIRQISDGNKAYDFDEEIYNELIHSDIRGKKMYTCFDDRIQIVKDLGVYK